MSRQLFLTASSLIAFSVGVFALFFPAILLQGKGVLSVAATLVWTREVGILLIAMGMVVFSIRSHEDNSTLKAILFGNIIIQAGLFLIEFVAYISGVITMLSGVLPNLTLHVLLAAGFLYYWSQMKLTKAS